MLLIQDKRVNWDTCQVGIPGATAKDKENRRIPFNPKGRLAAILNGGRSWVRGVRVRQRERHVPAEHPDRLGDASPVRLRHRATVRKEGCGMEPRTAAPDRSAVARPASRRRVSAPGGRRRHPDHSTDARPRECAADAAIPQHDGRGTAKRVGGELEKPKPAASTGVRKLTGLFRLPDCPRFVPGSGEVWLRGRDLNPRPLGYEPNELPDCSTPRQCKEHSV